MTCVFTITISWNCFCEKAFCNLTWPGKSLVFSWLVMHAYMLCSYSLWVIKMAAFIQSTLGFVSRSAIHIRKQNKGIELPGNIPATCSRTWNMKHRRCGQRLPQSWSAASKLGFPGKTIWFSFHYTANIPLRSWIVQNLCIRHRWPWKTI